LFQNFQIVAENSETGVWIDFALACKYIDDKRNEEVLIAQIKNPEKY
jgi:hypothetical protein